MNLFEILANPGVGNLLLLGTAFVGVIGSYGLYRIRLNNQRIGTRRAIKSELESMSILSQWADGMDEVPFQAIIPTKMYESHSDYIGLLSNEEVRELTQFYSHAMLVEEMIETNKEIVLATSTSEKSVDTKRTVREDSIKSGLDKLSVRRWQSLQLLKRELGENHDDPGTLALPTSEGGKIHANHPFFTKHKDTLISKGYFKSTDDDDEFYVLTKKGEVWFNETTSEEIGY